MVFAVIYVSNCYVPDCELPPCLGAMSPPGRQAGRDAHSAGTQRTELTLSSPVPSHGLALPGPSVPCKALLHLSGGADAVQVEGHWLGSDVPYPKAFNPVKRLPMISISFATKG